MVRSARKFSLNVGSLPLNPSLWISFLKNAISPCSIISFFQIEKHSDYMFLFNKDITFESFQSIKIISCTVVSSETRLEPG